MPGVFLVLDESHVHAFGQIKFNIRIITKLAQCGIKIYVVTDEEISHVIKSIVCTGKDAVFGETNNAEDKSTIRVVKSLCGAFTGT